MSAGIGAINKTKPRGIVGRHGVGMGARFCNGAETAEGRFTDRCLHHIPVHDHVPDIGKLLLDPMSNSGERNECEGEFQHEFYDAEYDAFNVAP